MIQATGNTATIEVAADTAAVAPEHIRQGVVVEKPVEKELTSPRMERDTAVSSWFFAGFVILFLVLCARYKKSLSIFSTMRANLQASRGRKNMFDDTVHESTFVFILDLVCILSVGTIACLALSNISGAIIFSQPRELLVAIGLVALLYLFQSMVYLIGGFTFATSRQAGDLFQSFMSSQAFLGLIMFPVAMISLFYPALTGPLSIVALVAYILARIVFISKGYGIFLPYSDSFLPFLYYLCAVEIVPVVFILKCIERINAGLPIWT